MPSKPVMGRAEKMIMFRERKEAVLMHKDKPSVIYRRQRETLQFDCVGPQVPA